MKYDGPHEVVVRASSSQDDRHGTLYIKNVTEMLWKQIHSCGKKDNMSRPERENASSGKFSLTSTVCCTQNCY